AVSCKIARRGQSLPKGSVVRHSKIARRGQSLPKGSVVRHSKIVPPNDALGLGCVKTPTLAPRVETSRRNCIPESQIILHTRGVMPSWRIVFSAFRDCMSFYTARVIRDQGGQSHTTALVRFASES